MVTDPGPLTRANLLGVLASNLAARRVGHPLRVGIDGVCGVGKSRFARDLVTALHEHGRPVARGIVRDEHALGGREAAEAAYDARYHAACLIYLEENRPQERADVVIDHEDPARPRFLRLDV